MVIQNCSDPGLLRSNPFPLSQSCVHSLEQFTAEFEKFLRPINDYFSTFWEEKCTIVSWLQLWVQASLRPLNFDIILWYHYWLQCIVHQSELLTVKSQEGHQSLWWRGMLYNAETRMSIFLNSSHLNLFHFSVCPSLCIRCTLFS